MTKGMRHCQPLHCNSGQGDERDVMATFFYCHCRPFYLSLRVEHMAISGKAKLKNQNDRARIKEQSAISGQQSAASQ